jgi:endo-1,4-beta-mannosidase
MSANSVRIFINHAYFEDQKTTNEAQAKLRVFLDLCADNNIAVLVTLFDLRPDYTISNLEQDMGHIDKVLARIFDHPAILGVDVKNQADLDFVGWGQGRVEGWLTVMARHIQLTYPNIAVTVGWSHPAAATGLVDVVDFVTYHEYQSPAGFDARLADVKSAVGAKPVMITELGSTIWTPFRTTKSAEKKQASRLENQLKQSLAADGVFVWTLNDFDHVGSDVVGWKPWRKAQQRHFGLVRAGGSARPARQIFQTYAADRSTQSTRHAQFPK